MVFYILFIQTFAHFFPPFGKGLYGVFGIVVIPRNTIIMKLLLRNKQISCQLVIYWFLKSLFFADLEEEPPYQKINSKKVLLSIKNSTFADI